MTYDAVASVTQVASLLIFVAMFVAVLAYVFWPRNRAGFDRAARAALDLANDKSKAEGRQ